MVNSLSAPKIVNLFYHHFRELKSRETLSTRTQGLCERKQPCYQLQIVRIFDFTNSNNSSNLNHCNHNIPLGNGRNDVRLDRIIVTIMQSYTTAIIIIVTQEKNKINENKKEKLINTIFGKQFAR